MEALKVSEHVANWNDDRIGELATDVKAGFEKVDKRFEKVEGEMKAGFAELRSANERLYRVLFISAISIVGVLITALAAALAT